MNTSQVLIHVLDIAILIAVLTQAVSLLDFILLPGQKEKFESQLKKLAINLEITNTREFHQEWLAKSRSLHLGEGLFGLLTLLAIIGPPIYFGMMIFENGFTWLGVFAVVAILLIQSWCWGQSAKVFESVGKFVFEALAEASTMRAYFNALFWFAFTGLLLIAAIAGIYWWLLPHVPDGGFLLHLVRISTNFYIGLVVTWIIVVLEGGFSLIVAILIWPIILIVLCARGFMRRVMAYPKGPLAALMTVLGSVLAVIRVAMTK